MNASPSCWASTPGSAYAEIGRQLGRDRITIGRKYCEKRNPEGRFSRRMAHGGGSKVAAAHSLHARR